MLIELCIVKKIKVFLSHRANNSFYLPCTFTRKKHLHQIPSHLFLFDYQQEIHKLHHLFCQKGFVSFVVKKKWSTSHKANGKLRYIATSSSNDGFSIFIGKLVNANSFRLLYIALMTA